MELQRFYTGYVSSAIPPHRYPQVYNIRVGGKRKRRRSSSSASESGKGVYKQTGKPSRSSPLVQAHSVSILELNLGSEDDSDSDSEKDSSKAMFRGSYSSEHDFVPLINPWPETSDKSEQNQSWFSYGRNTSVQDSHQTEAPGQVSVSYLPFQSLSDLSSTLEPTEPSTPPGLGNAALTILQLCDQLEYIANNMLPRRSRSSSKPLSPSSPSPSPSPSSRSASETNTTDSESLAESIMDSAFSRPGSLFDGDPFVELPPGNIDTPGSPSMLVSV
ncbi:hypothetical protein K435DRAFT_809787 [Dendrothele bispora CBS 962.96]|uniref:Uncharacterized protein n=1 Tax=Dendrothele bispora (strain CBS 962.96) TaxID=1314807 RepID=A0A4V4HBT2_DENBC|nr:hypothetical protein K435DRAFT_809787 [Dendrothele bispora CBS 962.96]